MDRLLGGECVVLVPSVPGPREDVEDLVGAAIHLDLFKEPDDDAEMVMIVGVERRAEPVEKGCPDEAERYQESSAGGGFRVWVADGFSVERLLLVGWHLE